LNFELSSYILIQDGAETWRKKVEKYQKNMSKERKDGKKLRKESHTLTGVHLNRILEELKEPNGKSHIFLSSLMALLVLD
jgi:hypothetical protein